MADLLDIQIEERPIIKDILDEKESMLIIGCSGLGKSLLSNEIALMLGTETLGYNKNMLFGKYEIPRMRKSIFIQSENTIQGTLKRIVKILDYQPERKDAMRNIIIPKLHGDIRWCGSFTDDSFREKVIEEIRKSGAEVLFIDPLISYHGENENDNGAMRRTLDKITEIQDITNTAAILVHHAGKNGPSNEFSAGRGASAIGDWAANIYVMHDVTPEDEMDEKKTATIIRLEHFKQRNHEPQPDIFLRRTEGLTFEVMDNPNKERVKTDMDLIVDAIKEFGGEVSSQTELINILNLKFGMTSKQARSRVETALKNGVIFCDFRGDKNSKIIKVSNSLDF